MFESYEEFEAFLCNRISKLRINKNISARDMSLSMGQGQGYVNNIENGNNLPSMKGFYYICEYLGISPKDFFDTDIISPKELTDLMGDLKELNPKQLSLVTELVKNLKK